MRTSKWLLAAVLAAGICGRLMAEDAPKPAVLEAGAASVTATVEKIDYKTREVWLKGPEGNVVSMVAGPEILRFNEIKKGDELVVDYLESVAVMVQSPDKEVASAVGTQSAIVRHASKRPSGTMVQTNVITATVVKVDAKKRTATLKGPEGNILNVNVAPDVQNLENVKKGDQVLVKVTQSLAMSIQSLKKK